MSIQLHTPNSNTETHRGKQSILKEATYVEMLDTYTIPYLIEYELFIVFTIK